MNKFIRGKRSSLPLYDDAVDADIRRMIEIIKIKEKYEYIVDNIIPKWEEIRNESKTDN